jgi:endonuclease-8
VPEGDTIHFAANRIRPMLEGLIPTVETLHRRFAADRWPERLAGRAVHSVDARGKHLFLRFEGGLVLHSHLRMTGAWGTYGSHERWHRARRRAWFLLRTDRGEVVQFDGPVLELMTEARARADPRIAGLGPDIIGDGFDEEVALRRLRSDDPTRAFGDALLDQRTVAGIGNIWKCESCFDGQVDPWRRAGDVGDDEIRAVLRAARPRMRNSAAHGHRVEPHHVYGRDGRPCTRCGSAIRRRGQGDDNRPTFWCAECQR